MKRKIQTKIDPLAAGTHRRLMIYRSAKRTLAEYPEPDNIFSVCDLLEHLAGRYADACDIVELLEVVQDFALQNSDLYSVMRIYWAIQNNPHSTKKQVRMAKRLEEKFDENLFVKRYERYREAEEMPLFDFFKITK